MELRKYFNELVQIPQRVTFSRRFLLQIADNMQNFLNIIDDFARRIRGQTNNPRSREQIAQSYMQIVMPAYQKLKSWVDWARITASQVPQRECTEIFLEAIKINYKNFDNMIGSMKEIVSSMRKWIDNLGTINDLAPYMPHIQKAFYNNVLAKSGDLAQAIVNLSNKVKELMTIHGRQYQSPNVGKEDKPYGDYGQKLADQMQRQQQAAKNLQQIGYGVSALQRGQQSSVPFVPVGKPARSMLNRG